MSMHPWTSHEVAQLRHEERVLRGIAAYEALRATEEPTAVHSENVLDPVRPSRLLHRLLRRDARPGETAPTGL